MVGCNHDAWNTNPKIWFENAEQSNEFGAAFTGARVVSKNRTTPQSGMNVTGLALVALGALLLLIPLVLGVSFLKKRQPTTSWKPVVSIAALNLLLTAYLGVLATNIYVYYFDAPFKHHSSDLVSVSSYTPFLLLIAFIPITLYTINQLKSVSSKTWIKAMLVSNNFIYLLLLIGFSYWGLYSVWLWHPSYA